MNFCFVYKEDYPWDVRVEKIVKTLSINGHAINLVCRNINQRDPIERMEDFDVYRLPRTERLPKVIASIINYPLWFNPFWLYLIAKIAIAKRCDGIIIRDLPLMLAGIIVARLSGKKVIFDMAECYPEMYRSVAEYGSESKINRLLKNPSAADLYEKICLRLCDHIFVMTEESRDRLITKGVDPKKITIVSNTPVLSSASLALKKHSGKELHIVYVGFITKIRGIDLLVKAVSQFIARVDGDRGITVDIIGTGLAKKEIESLVNELGLSDHITVHGWLDHNEVKAIMAKANVGALTYRFCGHWNHTIPNKIFDYMASGLPVLSTNVIPIARILNSVGCGLTTINGDIDEITANLISLTDFELRNDLGSKGQAAILNSFNWGIDSKRMLFSINDLFSNHQT